MSENWKTYKLRNICSKIGSGATPRGGKESYLEEGISLVRSQNVLDFCFSSNGLAFIDEAQAKQLSNVEVEEKDVLLNITGDSVARVCQIPKNILPARVNQHVAILRTKREQLLPAYLKYYLLNPQFKTLMLSLASSGGTRNALTKGMIEEFEINVPQIEEQRRIAEILSALDEKIELNLEMNRTLEKIAQATFKHWFVDFQFPGFDGELVDGLPKDWRIGEISDIYKTTSGGTPSRANGEFYQNGTVNWVKSKELNSGFVFDSEEKITETAVKNSSAKKLPRHSLLIAMYGATVGEYAILSSEATCNQAICAIIPNENYPFSYIFEYFKINKQSIINQASGSAQQNISQAVIQKQEIIIPPIEVVQKFHSTVSAIYDRAESNALVNQTLTQIRDSLLPKLMSGKIRVTE